MNEEIMIRHYEKTPKETLIKILVASREQVDKLQKRNKECKQEIERLNNIINEFEEWLLGEQMMFYKGSDNERLIRYGETKNKWLELKGSEKE